MKKIQLLVIMNVVLLLTACSSVSEQQPANALTSHTPSSPTKKKNPISVSIYTVKDIHPRHSYKVIGLETVSKYNVVGVKRQEANIKDTMRTIAAAMGGDAIINLTYEKHVVKGTVVSYKNSEKEELA